MASFSRFPIVLHPQLRRALPRNAQRDLRGQLFTRLKSQQAFRPPKNETVPPKAPEPNATSPASSTGPSTTPAQHARTTIRRGPPERILIYSSGAGKTVFLGAMRLTTVFIFGFACVLVAPGFDSATYSEAIVPAIIIGGALPMLFVAYTAAPFVNFVHLALPVYARRSREQAIEYAKNLPPTATLYLNTMRFTTMPRHTEVQLGDLVRERTLFRPVAFRNTKPKPVPWWTGTAPQEFYTAEQSSSGPNSPAFYPEVWEHVYRRIQSNKPPAQNSK
ncbi:hypothetical protein FE257_008357 [Aspergillus nanangensis]|uniref:Uncharacterized protein n=1 Tax=Aspergillus nanangensis TaxID=2582783 RepID=A0AAD4CLS8_ASPNN|nr:hypothetical protein FE257_008357 [Aspergillus nanangensis]